MIKAKTAQYIDDRAVRSQAVASHKPRDETPRPHVLGSKMILYQNKEELENSCMSGRAKGSTSILRKSCEHHIVI